MPADYEAISKQNERELGTKLKSRRTQISLYADPTHFVYELLQNADDHGATEITFRLRSDHLIVEHNGTERFQEKHVAAISSFEDSTSEDDLLRTGKFGLGFKSVFAFTETPRIYCGDECFEIYDLYRLRSLPKPQDLIGELTRFELPFNHYDADPEFIFQEDKKSADRAVSIVLDKFEALEDITLLFTRNLKSIQFLGEDVRFSWSRQTKRDGTVSIASPSGQSTFRVREKAIEWEGSQHRPVQIAIRLDDDGSPIPSDANLVVTFPTSISTGMGIILNGPYRTTPARETVGEGDAFNEFLVESTAGLLRELILQERDAKRLSLAFLEVLPMDSSQSDCPELFESIHDEVRDMLVEEEVIPTATRGYVAGKNAKIARGQYLTDLFSNKQLQQLFESEDKVKWLSGEVTEQNTPRLFRALAGSGRNIYHTGASGLVPDIVVRPENILAELTEEFLEAQSTRWIERLYCTLNDKASNDAKRAAESCPIIRLTTGKQVPILEHGRPAAYLPTNVSSKYPTVAPSVVKKKSAREYLKSKGYRTPDLSAEVLEKIIPKYQRESPKVAFKTHVSHLKKVIQVLQDSHVAAHVRAELSASNIVYCENPGSGEAAYCSPDDAYFHSEALAVFLEGNPDAWFCNDEYRTIKSWGQIEELFTELGVGSAYPRELCDSGSYECHQHGWHARGIGGFNPDWDLDGLEFAVSHPTLERAEYIWNQLLPKFRHRLSGTVRKSTRQDFSADHSWDDQVVSPGGTLLRDEAWIPTKDGTFVAANELTSFDELHESLARDTGVVSLLEAAIPTEKEDAAKVLGINATDVSLIQKHRDEFEEWKQSVAARQANRETLETSRSRNRDRRREKLKERKKNAPVRKSVARMRATPAYSSSEVDEESLRRFYRDEDEQLFCQICLDSMPFAKRDGTEFNECVTLLTKTWAENNSIELTVMTPLNLILCPVCSEIYKEYVHKDFDLQDIVFSDLTSGTSDEVIVRCSEINSSEADRRIHFDPTHLADIRDCLDVDGEA